MITFIALGGFLGAGKTTTLIATARALEARGRRVAVVTNDQGTDLVDTALARSSLDSVAEVTGGCFCCRFEDLMAVVNELLDRQAADTVIAEAVGSCTDLQATVVRPLRAYYGEQFAVTPLTTVVDPLRLRAFSRAADRGEPESDLSYLFGRQLADASILAVNKADLLSPAEVASVTEVLRQQYPDARVIPYSARTGAGLDDLIRAWEDPSSYDGDLVIDYDRYAAAEAQLAWLNQKFRLTSTDGAGLRPDDWARAALRRLAKSFGDPARIGHVKVVIESPVGLVKMSLTGAAAEPSADAWADRPVQAATAVINARVACDPAALDQAVRDAAAHADAAAGTRSEAVSPGDSFKPSYPRPVHRLTAAQG